MTTFKLIKVTVTFAYFVAVGWCCDFTANSCGKELSDCKINCTRLSAYCNPNILNRTVMSLLPCKLQNLTITKSLLSKLANYSFEEVVMLKVLNLSANQLHTDYIEKLAFKGLKHLESLDISRNLKIHRICPLWLEDLHSLKSLEAHSCSITKVHFAFLNNKNLRYIDFSQNKISNITYPFNGLKNLTNINLESNSLYSLPENMFDGSFQIRQFSVINLRYNKFQTVEKSIGFQKLQLDELDLSENPIVCDCGVRWFHEWLQHTNVSVNASCASPKNLNKQFIEAIDPNVIYCTIQIWIVLVVSASSIILVVLTIVVVYRLNIRKIYHKFILRRQYRKLDCVT